MYETKYVFLQCYAAGLLLIPHHEKNQITLNLYLATVIYFNFQPLEVVFNYLDPQPKLMIEVLSYEHSSSGMIVSLNMVVIVILIIIIIITIVFHQNLGFR